VDVRSGKGRSPRQPKGDLRMPKIATYMT
jgi:hypothetical protein